MNVDSDTIKIETVLRSPVENVWKAWTDASFILKWFGSDPGGTGVQAVLDPQPGGHFEITFANADGGEHTCSGVYLNVEKFRKLSFSWTWKSEPSVESFVAIVLTPENNFTKMEFEHAHVGTASMHNYLTGWKSTFEKLERFLSATAFSNTNSGANRVRQ